MCTPQCLRIDTLGLSPAVTQTLHDLYDHPIVRLLADVFAAADGQLFVVGGPVRDAMRGHADFADLDFTTDLRPEQTKRVLDPLGTLWTAGESRGTIAVLVHAGAVSQKVEVTTFRTEVYSPGSRKPEVGFGDHIVEDLQRRDLSVNAIAMNVFDGCLLDPFDGIAALAHGVLDTPDDPDRILSEDPLRILRAIRFGARLDARLADRLVAAATRTSGRLSIVSAERKFEELEKLAGLGPVCLRNGLQLAETLGVLQHWLPAATVSPDRLCGVEDLTEALAVLHHGIARPDLEPALRRLKAPLSVVRAVAQILDTVADVTTTAPTRPHARRLLRSTDDAILTSAARTHVALTGREHPFFGDIEDVRDCEPGVREPLPVNGNDLVALGLKGRAVGAGLAALEEHLCSRGNLTRDQALELASHLAHAAP